MTSKEITNFVTDLRLKNGDSVRTLSSKSGVSKSAIHQFGERTESVNLNNAIKLLNAYGYKLTIERA